MIVRDKPGLFDILFALRGSILPDIAPRLAFIALVSVAAVAIEHVFPTAMRRLSAVPFTLIGIALSIFMSFRNSACYERWWEARKLWGQMIIDIRSLMRQLAGLDPVLVRALCGFAHGLAAKLRDKDERAAILPWGLAPAAAAPNATDALLREIGVRCAQAMRDGRINPMQYSVLETQLTSLSAVQASCERIKTTPVPFAYTLMLHRTAHLFCVLLPFALGPALGWWTPLPVIIVGYAFFGLDALGDQLEDPFGTDANDLPLDAMVRVVEREILFALGETDLPPALSSESYALS